MLLFVFVLFFLFFFSVSYLSTSPLLLFRSLGATPISGKTLSDWKGHSRSSRRVPGYSRSSSRNSSSDSRNAKFHSRNGISRLEQYENQFSEQLPERFSELMDTHMKDFYLPLHSWRVFSRIGVVPARQIFVYSESCLSSSFCFFPSSPTLP